MTLYYCMKEVIDCMETLEDGDDRRFQVMVPVSTEPVKCGGHEEDAFILASSPKLLDLRMEESVYLLAQLIDDVPLYGINLELILDQALSERHDNAKVENALNQAFGGQPLPNTVRIEKHEEDDVGGGLRHPVLGHLDRTQLCELYVAFLKFLDRGHEIYNFERTILGRHPERFQERFDGYAVGTAGKVKAGILLAFGTRVDHGAVKSPENYAQTGRKLAVKMNVADPRELVWAWLEADDYQRRRCADIDRVLRLSHLPRVPNWVRTDIFCCIEKEAMKQVFAALLLENHPDTAFLSDAGVLREAMETNARNEVDPLLRTLASRTPHQDPAYAECARRFADEATRRRDEARRAGFG